MFNWYRDSTICYVFLEDVRNIFEALEHDEESFTNSRWFSRGWTVQELIAPREVEFYDVGWTYIGKKGFLADKIAQVTGIDASLLRGQRDFRKFSVAQRFSWAAGRQTTRLEDQAYSLLGMFEVNMPLLYGEGNNAFLRLQEEIIRQSTDLSILSWRIVADEDSFASGYVPESRIENSGLRISTKLVDLSSGTKSLDTDPAPRSAAILNCRYNNDITRVLALKITPQGSFSIATRGRNIQQRSASGQLPSRGTVSCTIGWPGQAEHDRIALVDVLNAQQGEFRHLVIRTTPEGPSQASRLEPVRELTCVWVRFDDVRVGEDWNTESVYSKKYWTHANRTFDLAKARQDKMAYDMNKTRSAKTSRFGLPIHGAIALSSPSGERVAIYFRQDNPSLIDGFHFDVVPYDADNFTPLNHVYEDRADQSSQLLECSDGMQVHVEMRQAQISGQLVVHLAVTIVNDQSVDALAKLVKEHAPITLQESEEVLSPVTIEQPSIKEPAAIQNSSRRRRAMQSLKKLGLSDRKLITSNRAVANSVRQEDD